MHNLFYRKADFVGSDARIPSESSFIGRPGGSAHSGSLFTALPSTLRPPVSVCV